MRGEKRNQSSLFEICLLKKYGGKKSKQDGTWSSCKVTEPNLMCFAYWLETIQRVEWQAEWQWLGTSIHSTQMVANGVVFPPNWVVRRLLPIPHGMKPAHWAIDLM